MISNHSALVFTQNHRAPLFPPANLVARFFQFNDADFADFLLRTQNSGFINDIGQLRAGHASGGLSEDVQSQFGRFDWCFAAVRLENRTTTLGVRERNKNFAIKTAGAEESFV